MENTAYPPKNAPLDRSIPPRIVPPVNLQLPPVDIFLLDNGIPVYVNNMGTQDITRIEVVFNAGRPYEQKPLTARATASLIREGTTTASSAEIAERLDFYGSELSYPYYMDTCNLALVTLNKHIHHVMPVFGDMLQNPLFPQPELDHFIQRNRERLLVELRKNDVIAYRQITEMMFGQTHPYGYNSVPDTYSALRLEDVRAHYTETFTSGNCQVFVAGKITSEVLNAINQRLGNAIPQGPPAPHFLPEYAYVPQRQYISRPNSQQTSVRIGRPLFNRHHEDYQGLFILNTILGGYFGSRLMNNIREEKGYTYNIYSTLETMRFDGYFYIATDVANEVLQDTLEQIYQEIAVLQEELIDEEELGMARSYLLGGLLTQIDGPFNNSELVRSMASDLLPFSFFQESVEAVHQITPQELRDLACKYLQKDQLSEVIVGP